jgi:GT2 family glycosyltransferase
MSTRTAVIHIGLHKTGTTSFQSMVARNSAHFARRGLFYPTSGRVLDGHHNLVWELTGDERYEPAAGSLADLTTELRELEPERVLLSSEDFELLHRRPDSLRAIRDRLSRLGYTWHVVAMLREPADYIESLYAELRKQGTAEELDHFVARAIADRGVRFRGWDFSFDYERLAANFAAVFGDEAVHVLAYDRTDSVGPLLMACGALLDLPLSPLEHWERWNDRSAYAAVILSDPSGGASRGLSAHRAPSLRLTLTPDERTAIDATFGRSVDDVVRRHPTPARLTPVRTAPPPRRKRGPSTRSPEYVVFASARGNVYMAELADLLHRTLADLGRTVRTERSGLPRHADGTVNLVVAPHEYFRLLDGLSEDRKAEAGSHAVCITTEQPGTDHFEYGARLAAESPLVVDINRCAADELASRGFPVAHLQLGYHPSLDHWGGAPARDRPIDVTVLSAATGRREQFIARAARVLGHRRCDIRLFTADRPVLKGREGFLVGDAKYEHLASSKVLLNVHSRGGGYFEWLRVVEAIANGCLVLSETSVGYQPLVPQDHFVEAPLDVLAEYASSLVGDVTARRRIATTAYEYMRDELDLTRAVGSLLERIEGAGAEPARRSRSGRPAVRDGASSHIPSRLDPDPDAGLSAEHSHTGGSTEGSVPAGTGTMIDKGALLAAAKRLLLANTSTSRKIEALQCAAITGTTAHTTIEETPAFNALKADVSVVIPLYNYASYVTEAVESVLASPGVVPEIIVVDDHSRDESVGVLRQIIAERPWLPLRLVAKHANQGVSAARNTGFTHARTEYVLVLDADNSVCPHALGRLRTALVDTGAALAYGIIACLDDAGAPDERVSLRSQFPWNTTNLVHGNYVDSMAMVRRSAWQAVGGYNSRMDEQYGGWEDYELWLSLAEAGYCGTFVPTFVGIYRVHAGSMLGESSISQLGVRDGLRQLHPRLPWSSNA